MSAIGAQLLSDLAGGLLHPSPAGADTESIQVEILDYKHFVYEVIDAIAWVFTQVQGAELFSAKYGKQIGSDLEQIAGDNDANWVRLLSVILPDSLSHLNGYVFSTGIVPLRQSVAKLSTAVTALGKTVAGLTTWKDKTVTPDLATLLSFRATVIKDYVPAIDVLRGWLATPGKFTAWATPILADPIVTYIASRSKQAVRDTVASFVADAAPHVWRHYEAGLAAVLNTEV